MPPSFDEAQPVYRAAVPCTCGELFQGTLDGAPCLVSCPIDRYSKARVRRASAGAPARLQRKARLALDALGEGLEPAVSVSIENSLPSGRGYGTSTADIGATLFGASRALDLDLSPAQAARLAVQVEPSDSTFFPGLALFDHRQGRFFEELGPAPRARLVILDPGGAVDSEAFNAKDWRSLLAAQAGNHRAAFRLLQQGVAACDLEAVGEAASLSARCHQAILFNPLVDLAFELARRLGAAGVCRAHSGTIAGLIFSDAAAQIGLVELIAKHTPPGVQLWEAALVGGGVVWG